MPIRLDERLTAIANLVDYGVIADIGCDHGKLGFYLLGTDRAREVIATDISEGSLQKARTLAFDNGLAMQTRLGDGLAPVGNGEAETVIIAGLGGDVISDILARARECGKSFSKFILSPNTHPEKVRKELLLQGHRIVFDDIVECSGKRYTIIKSQAGSDSLDDLQIAFGAFYAENKSFLKYAEEELEFKEGLLLRHRSDELERRVLLLKRAIANTR